MKKLYFLILVALSAHSLSAQTIRYVKPIAEGAQDGSSWSNASANLQGMINASASGDQVWVAAGTYKPTAVFRTTTTNSAASTTRDYAFVMKSGVHLYGGFSGIEGLLSQRNYVTNATILSGDLNGDDVALGDPNYSARKTDNVYHVVAALNDIVVSTDLDGFIIQDGYADGTLFSSVATSLTSATNISQAVGAGLAIRGTSTLLRFSNLIFKNNYSSDYGGAVSLYVSGSGTYPFKNVKFLDNLSGAEGGAMRIYSSSGTPTINLDRVEFENNIAGTAGGAIYYFSGTTAGYQVNVNIANAVFYNNEAKSNTTGGGAIYATSASTSSLINTTIYANRATGTGSTIRGGAIYFAAASATMNIYNSVLNSNTATSSGQDIYNASTGVLTIKNTLTQAYGTDGTDGNIVNASPAALFASTSSTDADFLTLSATSVALNAGLNSLSTALVDLANNPRIRNNTIDLGAYEFQTGNYPLPVKLESFTAVKKGTAAVLTWKTVSEQNNQKFVIERGSSATDFKFFKDVIGAGDSNTPLTYSITDFAPLAGPNYYRLTQYDNDGKSEVLGTQAVTFELIASKAQVYPNPAKSYIEVKPSSSNSINSLNLISLTGQNISTNNYAQAALNESVKLDLTNIPTGTYILWINKGKSNAEKQTLLVVK